MGLFDRFRKSKSTFPENDLEELLMRASGDASVRGDFYTKLMWSQLYVITNNEGPLSDGEQTLEEDTTVAIQTLDNGALPIFSSTNRIFDKKIIKEEVRYMAMKGQDFFELTKGATVVLNPFSDYGKEFTPGEIEAMLDGSIHDNVNEVTVEEDTEVLLGQPSNYPSELVTALGELFTNHPMVNAAYLCLIKMGNDEHKPHLLVGLDINGHMKDISPIAGALAENYLAEEEVIDFVQVNPNEDDGISGYLLKETEPFYTRD